MPDRTYAIGDIHGYLGPLRSVHQWIEADRLREGGSDVVVHVGDLPDRGPETNGVIQFLIDGLAEGQPWVVLKGNHDRMMSWYLESPQRRDHRLPAQYDWGHHRLGGLTTLASYGIDAENLKGDDLHRAAQDAVPVEHRAFLAGLDTVFRTEHGYFVHAGIRPGVALEDQQEDDLVWIREPFLSNTDDHGPLIVHGHTPVEAPMHFGNRVDIDSGVAFGGPLTVIVMEGRTVWNLTANGRVPLVPHAPV